ncbi:MAG: hypothetical protein U0136_14775 [Bdellovibrionota bacterium]
MIISLLLWAAVIFLGLPMLATALSLYAYRLSLEDIELFREAELEIVPVDKVRAVPQKTLRKFAESLRSIGFRELLGYTKAALAKRGNSNYCWVFVAPDGLTLGEAEYVRINWIERLFFLACGGRRYIPSLCGITLVSAFEGNKKFITTDLEQVEESAELGCQEIYVVPRGTPLEEAYARHCAARDIFLADRRLRLKSFQDQDDFVRFERSFRRYLTTKAEQELEDAWGESLHFDDEN